MFAGNQGYQVDGELVKAGLILPLDEYAKAYGWDESYTPETLQQFMWTDDGRRSARARSGASRRAGSRRACSRTWRSCARRASTPRRSKTFDDFDAALAKLREQLPADEPVIALGNKDQYGAIHLWGMVQGAYTPAQDMRDWIFQKDGATFDTPGNLESLEKIKEWADKGYLGKGDSFNSRNDAEAAAAFGKGEGALMLGGNWNASIAKDGLGKDAGVLRHAARRERQGGGDRIGEPPDAHLGQDQAAGPRRRVPRLHHRPDRGPGARRHPAGAGGDRRDRRAGRPARQGGQGGLGQARRGRRADALPGLVLAHDAADDGPDLPGDAGRPDVGRRT